MTRKAVGQMRNMTAKTKNGTTPRNESDICQGRASGAVPGIMASVAWWTVMRLGASPETSLSWPPSWRPPWSVRLEPFEPRWQAKPCHHEGGSASLLHIRADHAVPLLGDRRVRYGELIK